MCHEKGDHPIAGRMICNTNGKWTHLNCAYFSADVTEDLQSGILQKFTSASNKSRTTLCSYCNEYGATLHCCSSQCQRFYHFVCAVNSKALIRVNKEVYCSKHIPHSKRSFSKRKDSMTDIGSSDDEPIKQGYRLKPRNVSVSSFSGNMINGNSRSLKRSHASLDEPMSNSNNNSINNNNNNNNNALTNPHYSTAVQGNVTETSLKNMELFSFEINRRIVFPLVKRKGTITDFIRMGACTVTHFGTLDNSPYMHDENHIYPENYRAFRIFWSTVYIGKRTLYCVEVSSITQTINSVPITKPIFRILDMIHSDVVFLSDSCEGAYAQLWRKLILNGHYTFFGLSPRITEVNTPSLNNGLNGFAFFGLSMPHVVTILESNENAVYHALPPSDFVAYNFHFVQPKQDLIIRVREERSNEAAMKQSIFAMDSMANPKNLDNLSRRSSMNMNSKSTPRTYITNTIPVMMPSADQSIEQIAHALNTQAAFNSLHTLTNSPIAVRNRKRSLSLVHDEKAMTAVGLLEPPRRSDNMAGDRMSPFSFNSIHNHHSSHNNSSSSGVQLMSDMINSTSNTLHELAHLPMNNSSSSTASGTSHGDKYRTFSRLANMSDAQYQSPMKNLTRHRAFSVEYHFSGSSTRSRSMSRDNGGINDRLALSLRNRYRALGNDQVANNNNSAGATTTPSLLSANMESNGGDVYPKPSDRRYSYDSKQQFESRQHPETMCFGSKRVKLGNVRSPTASSHSLSSNIHINNCLVSDSSHLVAGLPGDRQRELAESSLSSFGSREPFLRGPIADIFQCSRCNPIKTSVTPLEWTLSVLRRTSETSPLTSAAGNFRSANGSTLSDNSTGDLAKQYRVLQTTPMESRFVVLRSLIHGWGMFATRLINRGNLVIEYVGEVISSRVANLRESIYNRHGIGSCYLFRMNDQWVIDSTKMGNESRFINHSCDANCIAKLVCFNNENKILIVADRDIPSGEEITINYNYGYEDDELICHCGTSSCTGRMN